MKMTNTDNQQRGMFAEKYLKNLFGKKNKKKKPTLHVLMEPLGWNH